MAVDYDAKLTDGTTVEQAVDFGFSVGTGAGLVPACWDKALIGLEEGDFFKLVCPADTAYGHYGKPPLIPPDAKLIYTIKIKHVASEMDLTDLCSDGFC